MEEMIFNSMDEALQMLADITGKRVMVPDKAEPKVASNPDVGAEIQEQEAIHDVDTAEDEEATNAEDNPGDAIQDKINKLTDLKTQVDSAMSQVKEITGS